MCAMIDFYASREHYVAHLGPIWEALPEDARGTFFVQPRNTVIDACRPFGIQPRPRVPSSRLTVVAAAADLAGIARAVLVEHGAGQSYVGVDHQSWSGGPQRGNVVLFIVPNENVAQRNRDRYPNVPYVTAAPYVEWLRSLLTVYPRPLRVVFSRHWDSSLCPELQSAWPYFFPAVAEYVTMHRKCGLHFHPRCRDVGRTHAAAWNVPYLERFEHVVRDAEVFVTDNSSAGFEWAALGLKTVWLNAPHYRRDVEHGLRFWSHTDVGIQVDDPADLHDAIGSPRPVAADMLAAEVFPVVYGAARLVADAIVEVA